MQIVINVLAVDNDIRIVNLFAASLALGISKIPFAGPVVGTLVMVDQKNIIIIYNNIFKFWIVFIILRFLYKIK